MIDRRFSNSLFWGCLLFLVLLNVIPIGNDASWSLSRNKILEFRLDYMVHLIMILGFAWIELVKRVFKFSGFGVIKFTGIVFAAAIGLELIQVFIPWRSFNPVDMAYNVLGAIVSVIVVYSSSRPQVAKRY